MLRKSYEREENESLMDYEARLYQNRSRYKLSWQDVNELLGTEWHPDNTRKSSYGYIRRVEQENKHTFDKSVMFINDIHLPFERSDVLDIIRKHAENITTLVIGGDLIDCLSVSSFPQIESLKLEDELVYAYNWIKEVRKILNKNQEIIIFKGNHEERYEKEICNLHKKDLQKFLNPELLDMLVSGFTLYEGNNKVEYKGIEGVKYIPHWFVNIDQKIVHCHPKGFSRVKGKMLENTASHFINRDEKVEVIIQGHTHKFSAGIVDRYTGVYVVENMCMCQPQSYSDKGNLGYSPQAYGYTIISYNDNEEIDYENIKVYHLKEQKSVSEPNYMIEI